MDLARPGDIKQHCDPNGLSTFVEYLLDYASADTRAVGEQCIAAALGTMEAWPRERAEQLMSRVRGGERDVYC
jgi:2-iminoacetate synthase